ncbi:MAG: hypothetical protein ACREYE_21395 [Gammaproteobacteria bacterium]
MLTGIGLVRQGDKLFTARLCAHAHHVHLLLTPEKAATVPKLVISLGRRYVP